MASHTIHGRVFKYGANINTDLISPAPYIGLSREIMLAHGMEGVDPEFPQKVRPGDIIVAGPNFGSGSSRESAPWIIKESGIGAVVAPLFARIFYRNAINIGLPVLTCEEVDLEGISDADELKIDPIEGVIHNLTTNKVISCAKLPKNLMELVMDGGLIGHLEKKYTK
jgi:3-isopropylmalate dehydratase small subunit